MLYRSAEDPLAPFKYDIKAAYVGASDLAAAHADNNNTIDAWEAYQHINERQVYVLRQYNDYCLSAAKVHKAFKGGDDK